MDLHSMEDRIKRPLNQHSQQHKQLSCTRNANMKCSTGQSGLIRTLRQVIKSTVASMNARQRQQTPQITIHMNENHTKKIHKLQVSGFTNKLFHVSKNNKTPTLCKFPKIHANFPVQNSTISFQSRIVTNHLIRSNWIKNTSTGAIPQDIALKSI